MKLINGKLDISDRNLKEFPKELFSQPDVDGGLVGGASLNADEFVTIINSLK